MLKEWRLAVTLFIRECRAGQWLIVLFALTLAVATITGIDFFTDRLARGLDAQSAQLLGGDMIISSNAPIPETWRKKANDLTLSTADLIIYPSVVSANNQLQLVNIQAVSNNYPLFGTPLALKQSHVMTELRLMPLLNIHVGDSLTIGAATFKIQDVLAGDIDLANTGWAIAPRVLMRIDDVPATQVVIPGSRVNYRLLLAGDQSHLKTFRAWITPQLKAGQTILDVESQRDRMQNSLQHADKYIQLIILFCLLMCGTAITLSVRQHIHRHYEDVALWRCLGAPQKQVTSIFLRQFLIIAAAAGVAGIFAGYIVQSFMTELFSFYFHFTLPHPGYTPIMLGFLTSTLLLFCYAYPIISVLPHTSPLYLWRSNTSVTHYRQNTFAIITLVLLLAYVYWMMDFSLLALFIIDSLLLSIGFLYVINILALSFIRKLVKISNGAVRRGLSQFIQHPETAGIQLTAFTLILMSLIILGSVKNDILGNWQTSLPPNTPNYFAFNIAPYDLENVLRLFKKDSVAIEDIYPMVRGRLVSLNDKPIMQAIPETARQHNALHRELNISSMIDFPSDNKIVHGNSWDKSDNGKLIVSVEKSLAAELYIKIGDKLGFQVGDQNITAVVSNIRSVDWGSFHPNFYIIFPPETLDKFPTTFITSFHLSSSQTMLLNQFVREFPSVTIIDVASVLKQIQDILSKTASALQYLFLFAIFAAVLIFIASLLASMDERRETYRLLRVLGASRTYIVSSLVVEFSFLTFLTLCFSFALAKIISYFLITFIF